MSPICDTVCVITNKRCICLELRSPLFNFCMLCHHAFEFSAKGESTYWHKVAIAFTVYGRSLVSECLLGRVRDFGANLRENITLRSRNAMPLTRASLLYAKNSLIHNDPMSMFS